METVTPPTEADAQSRSSPYLIPGSIVLAGVLVAGAVFLSLRGGSSGNTPTNSTGNPLATIMALRSSDVILGNKNAPVTLIEYGDYQCPYCARLFQDTEPQLRSAYIETGKAKMVFRDLAFLGPESVSAAAAASCANDQGQFWAYHDALYNAKIGDTANGGTERDGFFNNALFVKLATNLKLDVGAFTGCIASKKYDTQVQNVTAQAEQEIATALGQNSVSTPTVFVNDKVVQGAQPFTVFQATIDGILQGGHS